ncbi:MAG: WG repeat-containing protein, partial [Ruminococcus sp.]|nr:WG repeat-containing protein [Ruminococcus sp.]
MKNRIKAFGLCLLMCFSLTGCSIPGLTQDVDDEDDYLFTKPATSEQTEINTKNIEYKWLINPQIRASNIISFDGSQIDPDLKKNESYKKYSIIYNDGKYGFIDYNGQKVVSPSYEHFYLCPCGEMVLYNVSGSDDEYDYCTINSSGKVKQNITKHENNTPIYYWDSKSKETYVKNPDYNFVTKYNDNKSIVALKTEITKLENGSFAASQQANPSYGLIKNNKIILDFKYENYYTPASDITNKTIIAFKQDGKWGYING